jgi:universal stress protein E
MKLFKNILYVIEETADQLSAVKRAVSLAENNEARLTVIDVISPVPDDYRAEKTTYHMKAMESLIEPHRNLLEIKTDVLMGAGFLEVIRAVLRNSHDLLIKPAENPDFMKRLFGSNDMHLLRKCPCPVWIMKPPEKPKYHRILAAVDFDPLIPEEGNQALNLKILESAGSLALTDGASLHLAHAWEAYAETAMRVSSDVPNASIVAHTEKQYLLHQKGLYKLGETLRGLIGNDAYERLSPRFHLPKGPPKKTIAALAAELQVDLVVMGTVARTGISGLIIGNTAETILDQLSCSVLAVKPPGFITPVKLGA